MAASASEPDFGRTRIAFVVNASKRSRRLERWIARTREWARARRLAVAVAFSRDFEDLTRLARRVAGDGYDTVAAVGGDGTLLGVLNGLVETNTALAVVPFGTANDFARCIGTPTPDLALEALGAGTVRHLDLVRCSYVDRRGAPATTYFCSSAGVGLVAQMVAGGQTRALSALKRYLGSSSYVLAAVKTLLRFSACAATVTLDTRVIHSKLLTLEVNKVPRIGDVPITPLAAVDNGALDACLVEDTSLWKRLSLLSDMRASARHLGRPGVQYFCRDPAHNSHAIVSPKRIDVETERPMPLHLNGECVGVTPARFEVVLHALPTIGWAGGQEA